MNCCRCGCCCGCYGLSDWVRFHVPLDSNKSFRRRVLVTTSPNPMWSRVCLSVCLSVCRWAYLQNCRCSWSVCVCVCVCAESRHCSLRACLRYVAVRWKHAADSSAENTCREIPSAVLHVDRSVYSALLHGIGPPTSLTDCVILHAPLSVFKNTYLTFFSDVKKRVFYFFWNDLSQSRKKSLAKV